MSSAARTRPAGVVPVLGVADDSIVSVIPYEELPDPLRAELAGRVERLGYLGGFFGLAAHQPQALLHFHHFTESLKSALPAELAEVVALASAAAAGNEYELVQHIRLARSHGQSDDWISAAAHGESPGARPLTPAEREVRALVRAALDGAAGDEALRAVVTRLGEPAAVAVLLLTGRYAAHALVGRALRLGPPVSADQPTGTTPEPPPTPPPPPPHRRTT